METGNVGWVIPLRRPAPEAALQPKESYNGDRQALIAGAMGRLGQEAGDVLDQFTAGSACRAASAR